MKWKLLPDRYNPKVIEKRIKASYDEQIVAYDRKWFNHVNSILLHTGRSFSGEKTPGQAVEPEHLWPDYYETALRTWKLSLYSDFIDTVQRKMRQEIVGVGLTMSYEPKNKDLAMMGYQEISKEKQEEIQRKYRLHTNSPLVSRNRQRNMASIQDMAMKNMLISGDVLAYFQMTSIRGKLYPTIQLIDGTAVVGLSVKNKQKDITVIEGVESNKNGVVLAYHIRNKKGQAVRIKAFSGVVTTATLVKGEEYRIDSVRGQSLFMSIIQKVSVLDRYSDAITLAAEKVANYPIFVTHDVNAIGVNPFHSTQGIGKVPSETMPAPTKESSYHSIDKGGLKNVRSSLPSTIMNVPPGGIVNFPKMDFTETYATFSRPLENSMIGITLFAPEVIRNEFNSNYTAARAGIVKTGQVNEWYREKLNSQLDSPFFRYYLIQEVANGGIDLPQLRTAIAENNEYAIEAIMSARWMGQSQPNIDPKKTVAAIRQLLGTKYEGVPLITLGQLLKELGVNMDVETFINTLESEEKALLESDLNIKLSEDVKQE